MQVVDIMKGTGIGISPDGQRFVRYELLLVEIGHDGNKTTDIQGWVLPTFGMFGETLILTMQDGRRVSFVFLDNDGVVSVKELSPSADKCLPDGNLGMPYVY